MSDTYYLRNKGRSVGPYTLAKIQQMARKGQVSRSSEVSTDGQSWSQAASFPEIFERPASTSAAGTALAPITNGSTIDAVPTIDAFGVAVQNEWYYASGGNQNGPTSASQIMQMLQAGTLSVNDRVWKESMANWTRITEVPEFMSVASAPAPAAIPAWPMAGGGGPAMGGNAGWGGPAGGGGTAGGNGAFCRECGATINRRAVMCPQCGVPTATGGDDSFDFSQSRSKTSETNGGHRRRGNKSKSTAGILALLLGGIGIHHFYLENPGLGIVYLLFCWTLIPGIVAFIEAIIFLTMSEEAFDAKYNH